MPYEKLKSLVEKLHVGSSVSDLSITPVPGERGGDFVSVHCMSYDKNYLTGLQNGMTYHVGSTPVIGSEDCLELRPSRAGQEFFRAPRQFHYMNLSKADIVKLCDKFGVSFYEVVDDCKNKIIIQNPLKYG